DVELDTDVGLEPDAMVGLDADIELDADVAFDIGFDASRASARQRVFSSSFLAFAALWFGVHSFCRRACRHGTNALPTCWCVGRYLAGPSFHPHTGDVSIELLRKNRDFR